MTLRLLVLNCYSRNSMTVIKGLEPSVELVGGDSARRDFRLGSPDSYFHDPRLKTIVRHRDPIADTEGFADDIIRICDDLDLDAVIATGTDATNHLSMHKRRLAQSVRARILVEDYDKLALLTDKWFNYRIVTEAGIPTPKTALLRSDDGFTDAFALRFPIVVKPRISFAAKGVQFFESLDALRSAIDREPEIYRERCRGEDSPLIAQEREQGELHDVCICAKDGEIYSMLTQQRVVQLYDFGGGGIINKTTRDEVAMDMARRYISHVRWNGMGQVEYLQTPEGFKLLEFNPKVWGTSQLTSIAGLPMIQQMVDLFALDREPEKRFEYTSGLLYRWLFPECLAYLLNRPRNPAMLLRRMRNIISTFGASEIQHNLKMANLRHLIGIVLNEMSVIEPPYRPAADPSR